MTDHEHTHDEDDAPDALTTFMLLPHQADHMVTEAMHAAEELVGQDGITPEDAANVLYDLSSVVSGISVLLNTIGAAVIRSVATHRVTLSTAFVADREETFSKAKANGHVDEDAEISTLDDAATTSYRIAAALGALGVTSETGPLEEATLAIQEAANMLAALTADPRETA